MSELSKYLVEQILLGEASLKNIVVIYPGRFQPMHKGHYATYQHLVKKFGKNNVYIGTSDKVEKPKSPFSFKEKKLIMTTMFGIPSDKIVQIKQPYQPVEILKKYDEETTAFVTVVGEKDKNRLGGKYFQPWNDNPTEGFRDRGYVYVAPSQADGISGTETRNNLSLGTEEQKKEFFIKRAYGKFNQKIFDLITTRLNERVEIKKQTIEEWLLKCTPLLTEITGTTVGQDDDGPTFLFPNFDIFKQISAKRAAKIGYEVLDMVMNKDLEDYYEHPTYPTGPVTSVSYYPAGVLGANTPNNQFDIYSSEAYDKWYAHMTRKAALAGYTLVLTQLEREIDDKIKALSGKDAEGDIKFKNKLSSELDDVLREAITLPVEIGDTILTGKFKNKKTVVKSIGEDENGIPTINGKKVITFRYIKENYVAELANSDTNDNEILKNFQNLGISRENMPQITNSDIDDYKIYLHNNEIDVKEGEIEVSSLKLTQKEINLDTVRDIVGDNEYNFNEPIVISNDNYILDGHHRVVALYTKDSAAKIPMIRVDLPIRELLRVSHQYKNSYRKNINEAIANDLSKKYNIDIDVYEYPTHLELRRIVVPKEERGKGVGTKAMEDLIKYAEKSKKDLFTTPSSEFGGSKSRLVQFYKSFGFNNNTGSKRDFRSKESMVRLSEGKVSDLGIRTFKDLFNTMPSELQKRVYNLKSQPQNPQYHPEGNVLKHTITVVTRSLKDDDIDIAIAAMLHDIGKDETAGVHPTKGHVTHYGHEAASAKLVKKYKTWIEELGGNPANIHYIIKNHMRYKQLSVMKPIKQDKLKSFRSFDKLDKFGKHDRGGLGEINEANEKLKLKIPSDIRKIHTAFKKNGKKLYVVGGAVRDAILGKNPKDFDLATDAKPDETLAIAKEVGFNTVEVGKSFGVVIVGGHEIASFRKDITLKDNAEDFVKFLGYKNIDKKKIEDFKKKMRY